MNEDNETILIEQGKERAAEVLALYYAYGTEFWALSVPHYRILRTCQLMANLLGGHTPDVEMVKLFNKKRLEMVDPEKVGKYGHGESAMSFYDPDHAAKNVPWYPGICKMLGFNSNNLSLEMPINVTRKRKQR